MGTFFLGGGADFGSFFAASAIYFSPAALISTKLNGASNKSLIRFSSFGSGLKGGEVNFFIKNQNL